MPAALPARRSALGAWPPLVESSSSSLPPPPPHSVLVLLVVSIAEMYFFLSTSKKKQSGSFIPCFVLFKLCGGLRPVESMCSGVAVTTKQSFVTVSKQFKLYIIPF